MTSSPPPPSMRSGPVADWIAALRVNQWTKNSVVLAALFFGLGDRGQQIQPVAFLTVLPAALLFCLASSSIYLFNDLRDLADDRNHPTKRWRPIAAGRISPSRAAAVSVLLLLASLAGSFAVRLQFGGVVAGYIALQLVYTTLLKRVALVDIVVIATGFVLRALAGAVAMEGLAISPWLLLCTFLLALFLAICKRRHEKILMADTPSASARASLAAYDRQLLDQLIAIVAAATIVSYAVYTLWPATVEKFGTPLLGLTIPFVIFGMFRYLDLVYRHEKGDRPEKILLTDIPLLLNVALYGVTVLLIFLLRTRCE